MSFVQKILTEDEIIFYNNHTGKKKIEFLAGRFAAKEAIIKAFSSIKTLNMLEINIYYVNEVPSCTIDGYDLFLSISHDGEYAIANALIKKTFT